MNKIIILLCLSTSSVYSASDIVVTNYVECTEMATHYIKRNATPPELAIIVAVCEAILNPNDCGLGGGFQAVIYNGYCKEAKYLDAEVTAPKQLRFDHPSWNIGVPSSLKGYQSLYEMNLCGMVPVLSWSELFVENIKLAHGKMTEASTALEQTLKIVAHEGPSSSLYKEGGCLNRKLMTDLIKINSSIISSDLSSYKTNISDSFKYTFLNYTIATTRKPGSGSILIFGCKIIQAAHPRLLSLSEEDRTVYLYHTLRFMLSIKPLLRSKHFVLNKTIANARNIANSIFSLLENNESSWRPETITTFGNYTVQKSFPHHFTEPGVNSIIIKRGKYSIVMSNNRLFSTATHKVSRLRGENFGSQLNNQLYAFDIHTKDSPNRPSSKKAPQSQVSSIILYSKNNNPVLQIGASLDGDGISATFNTLFNYIINDKTLEESAQTPYCTPEYHGQNEKTICDRNVSKSIIDYFEQRNITHHFKKLTIGVVAASTKKKHPEAVSNFLNSGNHTYIDIESKYYSKKKKRIITTIPQPTSTDNEENTIDNQSIQYQSSSITTISTIPTTTTASPTRSPLTARPASLIFDYVDDDENYEH